MASQESQEMKELEEYRKYSFHSWNTHLKDVPQFSYRVLKVPDAVFRLLQEDGVYADEDNRLFSPLGDQDDCQDQGQGFDEESNKDQQDNQGQGFDEESNQDQQDTQGQGQGLGNSCKGIEGWNEGVQQCNDKQRGQDLTGVQNDEVQKQQQIQGNDSYSQTDQVSQRETNLIETNTFRNQIDCCIKSLGGKVVPKLNWSAPLDALWVNGGEMACRNADEVMMLLKCSDRVQYDVEIIQKIREKLYNSFECFLLLKKAGNLRPEREFRCFVRNTHLVGVSQRHIDQHFRELQGLEQTLLDSISSFYLTYFSGKQITNDLSDFIFDVYITSTNQKVYLIDINAVGGSTSSLLFDWEELYGQLEIDQVEVRLVGDEQEGVINKGKAMIYGVPFEFSGDMNMELQGVVEQAQKWWLNSES
eukprot:TRINITY_DN3655_c0_g1_i3.p1 TRINITY_DN3655_c0_g1~~TRINITY_DN3655_c0_g1_i3.p1  ORF type:complete len:417 (-),score=74.41 TRINITY_DN3655_c0_g1_i3:166-1416(-)